MESAQCREPWNKGKLVGQKPPLKPKDIWAIRIHLQKGEPRSRPGDVQSRNRQPSYAAAILSTCAFATSRMVTRSLAGR